MDHLILLLSLFIMEYLLPACLAAHNPGILFQIPTPYELPAPPIWLPVQIPSPVIPNLSLTDVFIRQIKYSWKYQNEKFVMAIDTTVISFHWWYDKYDGIGATEQQYTNFVVGCAFGDAGQGRFKLDLDHAQITQDKRYGIFVVIDSSIPSAIATQVSGLIKNYTKPTFRAATKKAVSDVILDFTIFFRQDIKYTCRQTDEGIEQCIYLNTTLVGKSMYSDVQILQINGAPYLDNKESGYLDPNQTMQKISSKDINIQVHEDLISKVAQLYNQICPIDFSINSTDFSDFFQFDSQYLSVIFSKMKQFLNPRPIIIQSTIQSILAMITSTSPPVLTFQANFTLKVDTQYLEQSIPYIKNSKGQIRISYIPITNKKEVSSRIQKIVVTDLFFDPSDIKQGLINPTQFTKHLSTLSAWTSSEINGVISKIIKVFKFAGFQLQFRVGAIKEVSLQVEVVFLQTTEQEK